LSKIPLLASHHHTNEAFLHAGKRFHVSRGFAEVEIEAAPGVRLTLMTAHLKSKRIVVEADQQELREEEALVLRERIDEFFRARPNGNLVVLGDFNDGVSSRAIRTIIGRGRNGMFDPRPAERNGDNEPNPDPRYSPRQIVWTHYFGRDETYSRLDYILLSPSLRGHINPEPTYIPQIPNWGIGSDHRAIMVGLRFN
jgi:endonuclease/exonuclease/phosphatase family metal-dependent hydrolase